VEDPIFDYPNEEDEEEEKGMYGTIRRDDSSTGSIVHQYQSAAAMPLELMIKGKKEKLTDEEI
jgi:hypothetical protein